MQTARHRLCGPCRGEHLPSCSPPTTPTHPAPQYDPTLDNGSDITIDQWGTDTLWVSGFKWAKNNTFTGERPLLLQHGEERQAARVGGGGNRGERKRGIGRPHACTYIHMCSEGLTGQSTTGQCTCTLCLCPQAPSQQAAQSGRGFAQQLA